MSNPQALFNQLSLSLQQLKDLFDDAVSSFNSGDWNHLQNDLLDQQIVAGSITKPWEIHHGIPDVIAYLKGSGGNFQPVGSPLTLPFAKFANLNGIASWKDPADKRGYLVVYEFQFVDRGEAQPKWRILRLFATSSLV